jgi:hypothetical protein
MTPFTMTTHAQAMIGTAESRLLKVIWIGRFLVMTVTARWELSYWTVVMARGTSPAHTSHLSVCPMVKAYGAFSILNLI